MLDRQPWRLRGDVHPANWIDVLVMAAADVEGQRLDQGTEVA